MRKVYQTRCGIWFRLDSGQPHLSSVLFSPPLCVREEDRTRRQSQCAFWDFLCVLNPVRVCVSRDVRCMYRHCVHKKCARLLSAFVPISFDGSLQGGTTGSFYSTTTWPQASSSHSIRRVPLSSTCRMSSRRVTTNSD